MDEEGLLMDNENYQKFIAELYNNSKFLDWTNDMAILGGYMAGNDISSFRSDVANLLYRHHKKRKHETRRREFYNNIRTCFRDSCDRPESTVNRHAYKDYYCSEECYNITGIGYAIARSDDLVESGVWDEYPEYYESWKKEREEWIAKYEEKYNA